MIVFAISQTEDGTPTYYSPEVGRLVAASAGWTPDPVKALCFARRRDAQTYVDFHLGFIAPMCNVVPVDVTA